MAVRTQICAMVAAVTVMWPAWASGATTYLGQDYRNWSGGYYQVAVGNPSSQNGSPVEFTPFATTVETAWGSFVSNVKDTLMLPTYVENFDSSVVGSIGTGTGMSLAFKPTDLTNGSSLLGANLSGSVANTGSNENTYVINDPNGALELASPPDLGALQGVARYGVNPFSTVALHDDGSGSLVTPANNSQYLGYRIGDANGSDFGDQKFAINLNLADNIYAFGVFLTDVSDDGEMLSITVNGNAIDLSALPVVDAVLGQLGGNLTFFGYVSDAPITSVEFAGTGSQTHERFAIDYAVIATRQAPPPVVPEPSTLALAAFALAGIPLRYRRRKAA